MDLRGIFVCKELRCISRSSCNLNKSLSKDNLVDSFVLLIVEDNRGFSLAISADLQAKADYAVRVVKAFTLKEALTHASDPPDAILLDLDLPDSQGMDTVKSLRKQLPQVPIIVLTGRDCIKSALEAIKNGAQDYVIKGEIDGRYLARAIQYAVERMQVQRQLISISNQREDFMAVLSHDLKNNLVGCERLIKLLLDGVIGDLTSEQIESLSLMHKTMCDSILISKDMLELYRYESGKEVLRIERADLTATVQRAIHDVQGFASYSDVKLNFQQTSPTPLEMDCIAIEHVVVNLLHNAIRFSPRKSAVEVQTYCTDDLAILKVKDKGQGLTSLEQESLFKRINEGRIGRNYDNGGTGLGLYLCHRILQLHNGTLSCLSSKTSGTTFQASIPLAFNPSHTFAPQVIK